MRAWHRRGGTASVNLHVRDIGQLYNSFDPSPFWDRDLDRDAADFIVAGIVIFLACMGARELLLRALNELPRMVDEGLIILAWIAMWRPLEALAYEWVPFLRKRKLYERLAGIRVEVRPAVAPARKP